jgi:hypothetical protein
VGASGSGWRGSGDVVVRQRGWSRRRWRGRRRTAAASSAMVRWVLPFLFHWMDLKRLAGRGLQFFVEV